MKDDNLSEENTPDNSSSENNSPNNISTGEDSTKRNGIQSPEGTISVNDVLKENAATDFSKFPIEIYPPWLRNYLLEVCNALPCPTDFLGVFLLGTFSALINNTKKIQLKNSWKESALLYIALISEPSTLKSPAMDKALLPIYNLQKSAKEQHDKDLKNYDAESNEPFPILEKHFVGDVTIEAAAKILDEQNRGFLYAKDELTGWMAELNQYKGGKGSDKQFWLSNWSGKPITVVRVKKEIFVESSYIPVMGAFQPDLISKFNSVEKDGFINRILISYPDEIKIYWTENDVNEATEKLFLKESENIYKYLKDSNRESNILKLNSGASEIWVTWMEILIEQISTEKNKLIKYSLSKMKGYTARFALILQLIHDPNSKEITEEKMAHAVRLAKYFIQHCRKTFSLLSKNPAVKIQLKVIDKLKELEKKGEITPRVIYKNLASFGYKNTGDALKLMQELEIKGFGEIVYKMPKTGGKKYTVFILFDD